MAINKSTSDNNHKKAGLIYNYKLCLIINGNYIPAGTSLAMNVSIYTSQNILKAIYLEIYWENPSRL